MNVSRDDLAVIDSLDLDSIKVKLMHKLSGEGWTPARVDLVEREYRRFLHLMKKYPNELTAPSVEVDKFWHQHILDTVKYSRDCQAVFGYFLHHYPYLGLNGEQDAAARLRAGQRMHELYEETFGSATASRGAVAAKTGRNPAFCAVTPRQGDATASCAASADCAVAIAATAFCAAPASVATATTFCAASAETAAETETAFCAVSDVAEAATARNRLAQVH